MALIFSSFPLRWDITWCCCYTTVVIHWSCAPLTFGRTILHVSRTETWLALQIPHNIFPECLGHYVAGQRKVMPSTAMRANFWQTQPFICQLIASPEKSLQRRSPCWLETWTLEPVQSVKEHICFHTEMDVRVNHKVNRERLKNSWFIRRDLESFPAITKLVLCKAGIYNLDAGIKINSYNHSRLLRGLKDLLSHLLIFHNMFWIDDSHRFNPFFSLKERVGLPAWASTEMLENKLLLCWWSCYCCNEGGITVFT